MKRIFPIIISLIIVFALTFTGCSAGINKLSVKDSVDASVELLTDSLEDDRTFKTFKATVSDWAKENDINIEASGNKYIILTKDAATAASSDESFTIHAGIDLSTEDLTEDSIVAASAAMTSIYSPVNHGKITCIFTLIKNGDPVGAAELDKKYLETDNFIDIVYSGDEIIHNSIALSSDMEAYKSLTMTSPQYTEAYQITFSGKEGQSAYKSRGTYPNPIQTIGDLLASCQSSTILFELASFNGGDDTAKLPAQASAVVVIHENDVESFVKKFDKSFEKVNETYEDIEDPDITFEYTMTPVELPSVVISKEDTENIVSLMYTMINGNYSRDEETDEVLAVSNIGKVNTENSTFTLGVNAKSLQSEIMDEIHTVVETVCGLCDIQYKEIATSELWINETGSPMAATLSEAMKIDLSCGLENKTASVFIEKNPDLNLVVYGGKQKDLMNSITSIIDYMAIAGVDLPSVTK